MTLMERIKHIEFLLKTYGDKSKLELTPETMLQHIEETAGYLWNLYEALAIVKNDIRKIEFLKEQEESKVWTEKANTKIAGRKPTKRDLEMMTMGVDMVLEYKKQLMQLTTLKEKLDGLLRSHEKKIQMIPGLQGWMNRQ